MFYTALRAMSVTARLQVGQTSGISFDALWGWLCAIAEGSRADVPIAIHSQSGDRAGWGKSQEPVVCGLPFSRSFVRRVDHELPRAVSEALATLKPSKDDLVLLRLARRAQWRVVACVVKDGLTDTEVCRARLGMSEWQFRIAAEGGIRSLQSALGRT